MSPRDVDRDVLVARLQRIDDLLADLGLVDNIDADRLVQDRLALRAVERILTQLVEVAVDIGNHLTVVRQDGRRRPTGKSSSWRQTWGFWRLISHGSSARQPVSGAS